MPKILKLFVLVAAVVVCNILPFKSWAQCTIKKKKQGTTLVAELPEAYFYNRDPANYNGLSVTLSQTTKATGITYKIALKFNFTNSFRKPQMLAIVLTNGDEIKLPMKLVAVSKTDNKNIHLNLYTADLPIGLADKLSQQPVRSLTVSATNDYPFSEVFTPDENLFTQMFKCLKAAAQ